MTLKFVVKLLYFAWFCYNLLYLCNYWMDYIQTWTKEHLGQDLLGDQTEFDLYVTLTIKLELLNLAKIAITLSIMDRFDWYLDKRTLMTQPKFWFLQVWHWVLYDLDFQRQIIEFSKFYFNFVINSDLNETTVRARPLKTPNWIWPLYDLDYQGQIIEFS